MEVMEATQTDTEQMVEHTAPLELDAQIEALLLVAERPMTEQRIVDIMELQAEEVVATCCPRSVHGLWAT